MRAIDALASIEQAIGGVRSNEDSLSGTIQSISLEITRLRAEEAGYLKELARIRLDALAQEQVVGNLNEAEHRALDALARLNQQLDALGEQRKKLDRDITDAQADRDERARAVSEAGEALHRLETDTRKHLTDDLGWQVQSAQMAGAIARAAAADDKARLSEQDRDQKSKPYLADRLFVYLWGRGYGTPSYRGGFLTRWGDGYVARVIGFEGARQNYFMLTEIPLRLREHAERLKSEAVGERAKLAAFERQAMETGGIVALEEAEKVAVAALDAAADKIQKLESSRSELDNERAKLIEGNDERGLPGIVEGLATAMARGDLQDLVNAAKQTPSPEDDRIVNRLQRIGTELDRLDRQAGEARSAAIAQARKRAELERAQDDFRRAGYDRRGGDFINEKLIGDILGGIIGGVLSSRNLNDALRSGYRDRSRSSLPPINIDFGGSSGGGSWGGGSGNSGGNSDDFRTGGGF